MGGQQALHISVQPLAAQPGRAGQVVPVKMQAGNWQALLERVLDFNLRAAVVIIVTDMQRLMDIGDQMQQPR